MKVDTITIVIVIIFTCLFFLLSIYIAISHKKIYKYSFPNMNWNMLSYNKLNKDDINKLYYVAIDRKYMFGPNVSYGTVKKNHNFKLIYDKNTLGNFKIIDMGADIKKNKIINVKDNIKY